MQLPSLILSALYYEQIPNKWSFSFLIAKKLKYKSQNETLLPKDLKLYLAGQSFHLFRRAQ